VVSAAGEFRNKLEHTSKMFSISASFSDNPSENYTRNEWRRCENYTRNEWRRCENYTRNGEDVKTTLEASGEDVKLHSNQVEKM
jgi:hypothetical protein